MVEQALISLTLIALFGIGASWLASRFNLPSILLLLLAGFLAGPVVGLIHPDELLGDLLVPIVEMSVAIILFEGALSLRIIELEEVGDAVRNLVTIGVAVTWIGTAAGAYWIVGLNLNLSVLLGAILVVTGPTVIVPILRQLRPQGDVAHALKWEGILIDPLGVILAVLTFEAILAGGFQEATAAVALTIGKSLVVALVLGVGGGMLIYTLLRRHWISDALQNPVTLALVLGAFLLSEWLQSQSGLAAVTIMGVVLANQREVAIHHIVEFKENLRVLFISVIFILLAARLELADIALLGWPSLVFLALLIVVVRPLGVWLSTLGTSLDRNAKFFLASMAPRGIVAAAISSVFALRLAERGYAQADMLVPLTFLVIVGTVAIYGLSAAPLSRWLDVATPDPQGIMLVPGEDWILDMAQRIKETGLPVLVADTNRQNLQRAWDRDLRTYHGSTLGDQVLEEINLEGIGHLAALTPNDEINALTGLHFAEVFERSNIYQLASHVAADRRHAVPQNLRSRVLFGEELTYERIRSIWREGGRFELQEVEDPGDVPSLEETSDGIPLFLVTVDGQLRAFTVDHAPVPSSGDELIVLVPP